MSLLSGPGTFKHIVQIESPKLTFYLNSVIKLKITVPSSEWCGIQLCHRPCISLCGQTLLLGCDYLSARASEVRSGS